MLIMIMIVINTREPCFPESPLPVLNSSTLNATLCLTQSVHLNFIILGKLTFGTFRQRESLATLNVDRTYKLCQLGFSSAHIHIQRYSTRHTKSMQS